MANLDKLLKRIEQNSLGENEQKTHELKIAGEKFEVLTMTRKEKQDFVYARSAMQKNYTVKDVVKSAIPYIYKSLQLSQLAQKAIDAKYIKKYHDVVEMLFEPDELLEIIAFIMEINNLADGKAVDEEISELKKQ